jgi:hypothetical protein
VEGDVQLDEPRQISRPDGLATARDDLVDSYTSAMNRRSREATVAVRPGAVETRPSRWSSSNAWRTGSRETPRRAASSSCLMRAPGRSAPLRIAPRISSAARTGITDLLAIGFISLASSCGPT